MHVAFRSIVFSISSITIHCTLDRRCLRRASPRSSPAILSYSGFPTATFAESRLNGIRTNASSASCLTSHLSPRTVSLGRFGSFLANELLGEPYGLTYEIKEKKLTVIPPKSFEEIGACIHCSLQHVPDRIPLEDTEATNELINDGQFVQPLTAQEIHALRQSGVHASVRSLSSALVVIALSVSRRSSRSRLTSTPTMLSRRSTPRRSTRSARRPSKQPFTNPRAAG